jgi:hypothetical protein
MNCRPPQTAGPSGRKKDSSASSNKLAGRHFSRTVSENTDVHPFVHAVQRGAIIKDEKKSCRKGIVSLIFSA